MPPSDEQWAQVDSSSPQRRGRSGFGRKISNRQAFEAGLFRARTGCPWRNLPGAYGDHHTIYMRWQRWVKSGVPPRALIASDLDAAERGELELNLAMIDSTVVRAHQPAAGARKKTATKPLAARVAGWARKIQAVSVSEHQVLEVILSGGQEGAAPVGEERLGEVLACEEVRAVGGDRAYDSDAVRALMAAAGKEAVIPSRCNRLRPAAYDKGKHNQRDKAERLFNKLKGYRGVATRYDKLATMFLGGVLAALLAIGLKSIVNTP